MKRTAHAARRKHDVHFCEGFLRRCAVIACTPSPGQAQVRNYCVPDGPERIFIDHQIEGMLARAAKARAKSDGGDCPTRGATPARASVAAISCDFRFAAPAA